MAKKKKYDHILLIAVLLIVIIGIVMITSIGVPKSLRISAPEIAYPDCADSAVDCYLILKNHIIRVVIGLIAMLIGWKINYRIWKKLSVVAFVAGVLLLFFVLFAGDDNNTFATSWINVSILPFVDSVQPSEVAKFGLITYLAYFFSEKISLAKLQKWKEGFLKFALIAGLIIGPVVLQPDLGSALVLTSIAVVIYFLAGANWKHFAIGGIFVVFFSMIVVSNVDYIHNRVTAFINPDPDCSEDYCWQTRQANIAIGSGGVWGKGLTQGVQKSYWLPQAADDFIFAASAEELGFLRTVFVLLLYTTVAYRGFQIANHAPNKFAMLMAAGISTWISAQAFINIMVNTALFPITGITLPFMSYGGSSMVMTLAAVGVLLNISKYTTHNAYSANGGGTGGHVVPNIAIADAIRGDINRRKSGRKRRKIKLTYIGSKKGIEYELARKSKIRFEAVQVGKLRRYFDLRNFVDLFRIPIGVIQAFFKLGRLKPDVIFSKGGFVGFPVVVAGWARRIPVIIHESDSIPGLTTKLSAPFASNILLGYKEAAHELAKYEEKIEFVGNPIRKEILKGSKARAKRFTGFTGKKPVLLVIGGSGGAEQLNKIVKKEKERMTEIFDVVHITGKGKGRRKRSKNYCSFPYLRSEMKDIYAIASLAVSRAGANSLAELEALQIPTLIYPLGRYASRGDQMANAQVLVSRHKIFKIADENKTAHSQLIMLPKRKKNAKSHNNATNKIAKIILMHAKK